MLRSRMLSCDRFFESPNSTNELQVQMDEVKKRQFFSKRLRERDIFKRSLRQKTGESDYVSVEDATINKLPDEILVHIFHKLPYFHRFKLEIVCRRWNYLSRNYGWTDFKALHLSKWTPPKDKTKTLIERAGKYLRELNLDEINWTTSGLFSRLSEMRNLRHISLSGKGDVLVTSEQLAKIAESFPNLLTLNIWKALKFDTDSNSSKNATLGLSFLLSKCKCLEYLSLCRANNADSILFQPTVLPPKLAFLETDDTFDLEKTFQVANEQCKRIRCLSLQFLKPTISSLHFVHKDMLKRLIHLELDFHKAPQPSFYKNFIKMLCFLGDLRILRFDKMTGETLSAVIERCPNIEDLGYSAYDVDILPAFSSLHQLTKLRCLIIRHHGKALRHISTQKDENQCNRNGDETLIGQSMERIALNGRLRTLSLNFPIPVGLMCNLVRQCECLTNLYCSIVRYQSLATLGDCMTELNEAMNGMSERVRRMLHISVNYQKSRELAHPYIRFHYQPDTGSHVVLQTYDRLFTSVPSFLYAQPDGNDDFEEMLD
uniref:F-box domain-containing protein n=1 Tax=Globodera rostochiensis TaxID=31243 RepID=A0A914GXM0_GLORO